MFLWPKCGGEIISFAIWKANRADFWQKITILNHRIHFEGHKDRSFWQLCPHSSERALAGHNCSAHHDDREEHLDLTQLELYRSPPSRNKSAVIGDQCCINTKYYLHGATAFCHYSPFLFSIDPYRVYHCNFVLYSQTCRSWAKSTSK